MILVVERLSRGKWQIEWEGEGWPQNIDDLTRNFEEHNEKWRVYQKGRRP